MWDEVTPALLGTSGHFEPKPLSNFMEEPWESFSCPTEGIAPGPAFLASSITSMVRPIQTSGADGLAEGISSPRISFWAQSPAPSFTGLPFPDFLFFTAPQEGFWGENKDVSRTARTGGPCFAHTSSVPPTSVPSPPPYCHSVGHTKPSAINSTPWFWGWGELIPLANNAGSQLPLQSWTPQSTCHRWEHTTSVHALELYQDEEPERHQLK